FTAGNDQKAGFLGRFDRLEKFFVFWTFLIKNNIKNDRLGPAGLQTVQERNVSLATPKHFTPGLFVRACRLLVHVDYLNSFDGSVRQPAEWQIETQVRQSLARQMRQKQQSHERRKRRAYYTIAKPRSNFLLVLHHGSFRRQCARS